MQTQRNKLNFEGQKIFIGMHVHKKDWKVSIRSQELTYKTFTQKPSARELVWRQSGCLLADSSVVIWQLTTRRSLSEPPPERQAARTLYAILGQCVGQENSTKTPDKFKESLKNQ